MLPRLSLLLRLALIATMAPVMVAAPVFTPYAIAGDDDDDDDDDGDDEDEEDEDEEDAEPQPPVTSGGMYTKKTYPVSELDRTLTVIGGMTEVRAGIDIDVGANTAFEIWRFKLDARYGLQDNVELQAGLDALLAGDKVGGTVGFNLYAGVEAGLIFEEVNVRLLAALPFVANAADPTQTDVGFDLIGGVPFRYKLKPNFAIIALDKILTIHTTGGQKPDLTVGVGGVYQLTPQVAALVRGEVTILQFDTNYIVIPATAAIQFSPNNKFDIGAEFTFKNFKQVDANNGDAPAPFDERSLLIYAQARF